MRPAPGALQPPGGAADGREEGGTRRPGREPLHRSRPTARPRRAAGTLVLLGAFLGLALGGCRAGSVACDSPCWPGPRIGPVCRSLCREPRLEPPCPAPKAPRPCLPSEGAPADGTGAFMSR
jgi:hypothetical protein